jgi:hypothetical protein
MDITHNLKKITAGALVSGAVAVAFLGLAPGSAHAGPTWATGPYQWCPGQPLPRTGIVWDMGVCHTWYVLYGVREMLQAAGLTCGLATIHRRPSRSR